MGINKLIIILYLCLSYLASFGSADRSITQWMILSFLNLLVFLKLNFDKYDISSPFKLIFSSKVIISYSIFIVICLLSLIYSINTIESLIVFTRYLTVYFAVVLLTKIYIDSKINFIFLSSIIAIAALIESAVINFNFIQAYNFSEEYGRSQYNRGLASNINIAAFSLAMKIPFVIYATKHYSKTFFYKLTAILILSTILFSIYLTGSRGALLAIYFQLILYFIYFLWTKFRSSKTNFEYLTIYFVAFLFSLIPNLYLLNTLKVTYRTQQIIERGSDSRLVYYKQALQAIIDNPFFGNGIGTWKIISNYYDRFTIEGYTVQYNVHNDFLQIFTEIGFFGFISYVMIFIFLGYNLLRKIEFKYAITLIIFLSTYFIDANLNFPIDRPMIQIMLILVIPFVIIKSKNVK